MQAGDGSLGALDIPELESLDGVVVVAEVATPLDPEAYEDNDGTGPFAVGEEDRVVDRLDEHAFVDLDEDLDEEEGRHRRGAERSPRPGHQARRPPLTRRPAGSLTTPVSDHPVRGPTPLFVAAPA